jgi:hypothetical protein
MPLAWLLEARPDCSKTDEVRRAFADGGGCGPAALRAKQASDGRADLQIPAENMQVAVMDAKKENSIVSGRA